jgi:predicted neutral ceramidase superfamily lipid hydrolase
MLHHNKCKIMEQELLTLPEHLSSTPGFSGVRVTRSLVLYACFVNHCLFFCPFSFGHCVVRRSSIYGFWLPLWYLHALLKRGEGVILCNMKYQNYRSSYLAIVSLIYLNTITWISPPYFCACPIPKSGFPKPYVLIFMLLNCLRYEIVVRFVYTGRVVDHHCVYFLFIFLL